MNHPSAIVTHIEFLQRLAQAPAHELASFAHAVETLPRILTGEAGDVAVMLASSARGVARQIHRATPEAQAHLRDAVAKLAQALTAEFSAHGAQPYHLRD